MACRLFSSREAGSDTTSVAVKHSHCSLKPLPLPRISYPPSDRRRRRRPHDARLECIRGACQVPVRYRRRRRSHRCLHPPYFPNCCRRWGLG